MRAEGGTTRITRVHRRRPWLCVLGALALVGARDAGAQEKDEQPESPGAAGPAGGKEGATGPAKPVSEKAAEEAPSESKDWNSMTWGELDPGRGFRVANTKLGDLWISGYALVRYINQLPATQNYLDHLGRPQVYSGRNDIEFHRALLWFRGWLFLPKLEYNITMWTVLSNNLVNLIGSVGYRFHKAFTLAVAVDGMPGIRSLVGSHPYWLAADRVMAEEFARPGFTNALVATGEALPGLFYKVSLGNNISQLGITAAQLTRDIAVGASVWWEPTTKEFGPRGGYGDWDSHEKVATRFGMSSVRAREAHYTPLNEPPGSTQIRLADGTPLFNTGALATNVTLQNATYWVLSADAGLKYRGLFIEAEYNVRWLYDFAGNAPVPVGEIVDHSFFVQIAAFPIKGWWELYNATSFVFGDPKVGFKTNWEVIAGTNVYPAHTRNFRLNAHFIYVSRSVAGGTFGYYAAGEQGPIVSLAASVFF